tara:strand:- start:1997 stop:2269 length:273 start_codon:yes stop_codon:yes gene_type:complete
MKPRDPQDWNKVASIAQTMALVITVACVFMGVGELKAQIGSSADSIRELRDVSSDLLKAQVTTTSNDVQYLEILNELRRRVDALERHVRQ